MRTKEAVIIGISVIIGCLALGLTLKAPIDSLNYEIHNLSSEMKVQNEGEAGRYQMISANDNNILLLDTKTGKYWRKFIETNSAPTNWSIQSGPDLEN